MAAATPVNRVRFDVLTLFPDLFGGYLTQSLLKLAIRADLVTVKVWNIRDWAEGKHQKVDDRPSRWPSCFIPTYK